MITIQSDADKLARFFQDVAESQLPFATMSMTTKLAVKTRQAMRDEMDINLELPITPFARNMLRYSAATNKANPQASVYVRSDNRQDRIFSHLFTGGNRNWKRFEGSLFKNGLIPQGYYAIPGQGATLNQYGNIPGPFITKLLSYFGTFQEKGYKANMLQKTKDRMARRKITSEGMVINGVEYFIINHNNRAQYKGFKHMGVYARSGLRGRNVKPILIFLPRRPYRRFLDLPGTASRVVDIYAKQYFVESLAKGIATSRKVRQLQSML